MIVKFSQAALPALAFLCARTAEHGAEAVGEVRVEFADTL
jgi:hypothetical protein